MDVLLIVIIAIFVAAFIVFVVQRVVLAHRRRISAGREELVGRTAEVDIALEPKGLVLVEGERWTAISEKGRVAKGEEVIINKVDGLKLYVTKKEKGGN
jgi:membrane-bound serine protease (ClpP class)